MNQIQNVANKEWNKAEEKLITAYNEWHGKGYGAHLHTDIYSNLKTSPMLNYIGMNYENKITKNLIHQSSLNTTSSRYYDPWSVLQKYSYKIRTDAWTY